MQLKRIHPLDVPLEVFLADLSTKTRNAIRAEFAYFDRFPDEDIKPPFTVRHLVMFSRRELKKWPGLGRKGLNEIEELLRARGLQLWDAHDERSLRLLREHASYFTAPPASQEQAEPAAQEAAPKPNLIESDDPFAELITASPQPASASAELPPLPQGYENRPHEYEGALFVEGQMRSYAIAARAAAKGE